MKFNILVTSAGGITAVSVIKALKKQRKHSVKIISVNAGDLAAGFCLSDKSYVIPLADDSNYIKKIIAICKKEKINVIIPTSDRELPILAKNRDVFSKIGCIVVVSDSRVVDICDDKFKTCLFFKQNGINTPETWTADEFKKLGGKNNFPVIIKPRVGQGSRNIFKLNNHEEFLFFSSYILEDIVVQEFIDGKEYTLDVLTDFDGNLLAMLSRERIAVKSGVSFISKTVKNKDLMDFGISIVKKMKFTGPANIQCIKAGKKIYGIEINPRFSGGLSFTVGSGINTPEILLDILSGKKINSDSLIYKPNIYGFRYWEEIFKTL